MILPDESADKTRLKIRDISESAHVKTAGDPSHGFALTFFQAYRTLLIHHADNEAVMPVIHRFAEALAKILGEESQAWLYFRENSLFVNHHRIALSPQEYLLARVVAEDLERRGVGGCRFNTTIDDDQAWNFFKILVQDNRGLTPETCKDWLKTATASIPGISFSGMLREDFWTGQLIEETAAPHTHRSKYKELYTQGLSFIHQLRRNLNQPESQFAIQRKLNRVFLQIVEEFQKGELNIFYMLPGPSTRYPHETHAFHTTLYTLLIGHIFNLRPRTLLESAHAALFHDIGRWHIEDARMQTEEEDHIYKGLSHVLKLPGLSGSKTKKIIALCEHHRRLDGSGFPERETVLPLHLIGRIVAVADAYDRLTLPANSYSGMSPFRAWGLLFQHQSQLDIRALRSLYHCLGPFPPGSYVKDFRERIAVILQSTLTDSQEWKFTVAYIQPPYHVATFLERQKEGITASLPYPLGGPPAAYWLGKRNGEEKFQ